MLATHSKAIYGLVVRRRGGHHHVLRFDPWHPMVVYAELERWLRDGLITTRQFVDATNAVTRLALAAREGTA